MSRQMWGSVPTLQNGGLDSQCWGMDPRFDTEGREIRCEGMDWSTTFRPKLRASPRIYLPNECLLSSQDDRSEIFM